MTNCEVMGVPLSRLEGPIRDALTTYQNLSGERLILEADLACLLKATPDKPNSARSTTEAHWEGNAIGKFYVIAFKPQDGTGDESAYNLQKLVLSGQYPRETKIVPRSKKGVFSEALLTIATHEIDNVHADPQKFGGTFDLLGFTSPESLVVMKIGTLGIPENAETLGPSATLTTGYHDDIRFGDPHAVYSAVPHTLQVCAFLAIKDEVHAIHPHILDSLRPKLPFPVKVG